MPDSSPKPPFAWLGDLSKLHWREQRLLLQGGLVLAVGGIVLACALSLLLFGLGVKAVAWWQLRESPWPGMTDRDFTRCVERAEELLDAAQAVRHSEQSRADTGDAARRDFQGLAEVFSAACGEERWGAVFAASGQAPLKHPADWLPFAGLSRDSWPAGVQWPVSGTGWLSGPDAFRGPGR